MNAELLRLLREHEGYARRRGDDSCETYLDPVGIPTLGYGFTKGVKLGDTMTRAQADARLLAEAGEFSRGVLQACGHASDNELAAMTSLAYNIGLGAFRRSTVLREHNAGNPLAASAAFLLWNKAGGRVLPGLVKRRRAEADLYLKGEGV